MRLLYVLLALAVFHASADSVRTSDGIACSFDADDSPFEVKAYTEKDLSDYESDNSYYNDNTESRIGFSLRYKFGGPKRLDCDKLYQLELRTKEARIKQLEAQVRAMEAVNSVDW